MSGLGEVSRKLVAVFAADVEGYSRLMGVDEVSTLKGLTERRTILDKLIAEHRGRIANTAGDSVLAEFGSAVDAVECAVRAQTALAEINSDVEPARRINHRIGVHVGDVLVRAGDLFGDGVNIAARLEGLADPGGICISSSAYEQVHGKVAVEFTDLGEHSLKNINRPIRAYGIGGSKANTDRAAPLSSSVPHLSLVVLPFANMGGDPEQDYFVDGVTESLTTDLSRIAGAFVIARNTAFTFKGKAVDVKKLGRELNVRYVLEGSVQRSGNRLRVNVQLIDAQNGNHIWADRFDKPVTDIFDMQDEIVSRLANALDAQFIAAEASRTQRSPHPDAMDLYFQGLSWIYKGTTLEHVTEAQRLFDRGLELDPNSVDLLVGKAVVDTSKAINFFVEDRVARLAAAEAGLTKALSIAPDHAYGHLFLGLVFNSTNRASQGIAECERALTLNRNLAHAYAYIGWGKYLLGRAAETEAHVNAALRLSPRDTFAYHWLLFAGLSKFQLKAYDEAVEWLRRSNEANRNYPIAYFWLAAALGQLGKLTEARTALKEGLAQNPGFTIQRIRSSHFSDNLIYLECHNRICEGLRLAGAPEG